MVNNINDFRTVYWNYFLELEGEFLQIEKFIPVDDLNESTFSLRYMKLLFSICSEIDIVFKSFMEFNGESIDNVDMRNYNSFIDNNFPNFSSESITCYENKIITPFKNWNDNDILDWWSDYNKIKHERTIERNGVKNYKNATQKNVLNALSGLYQLEMYFYKEIIDIEDFDAKLRIPVPQSKIFRINDWEDNQGLIDNRYILYINDNGDLILDGDLK